MALPLLYSKTDSGIVIFAGHGSPDNLGGGENMLRRALLNMTKADEDGQAVEVDINSLIYAATESTQPEVSKDEGISVSVSDPLVRDDAYYWDMCVFDVDDTLFWIPKHSFLQQTDAFVLLLRDCPENVGRAVKLTGILPEEFRGLMEYLYPLQKKIALTQENWVSTLKLSTQWKMLKARAEAISALTPMLKCPSEQVQLGLEFFVNIWVESGYLELVKRKEPVSASDILKIGIERAVKLSTIRETVYAANLNDYLSLYSLGANGFDSAMKRLFSNTFPSSSSTSHVDPPHDLNLVDRILTATELGIDEWTLHLYERLALRRESLTVEEVEKLGLEMAIKTWEARFEARKAAWSILESLRGNKPLKFLAHVMETFKDELAVVTREGKQYAVPEPPPTPTPALPQAAPAASKPASTPVKAPIRIQGRIVRS